jgi:hypothetical protein
MGTRRINWLAETQRRRDAKIISIQITAVENVVSSPITDLGMLENYTLTKSTAKSEIHGGSLLAEIVCLFMYRSPLHNSDTLNVFIKMPDAPNLEKKATLYAVTNAYPCNLLIACDNS